MTREETFLTVQELCARWHVDPRTLDKLVEAGGLGCLVHPPPLRLRRFPLSVVLDYEAQHFRSSTGMPA